MEQAKKQDKSKLQAAGHADRAQSLRRDSRECPHCHRPIPAGVELCPHCYRPVDDDHCTYCGAEMEPDDLFCPECGGSRNGVTCPQCGTLNFRSFCRTCNAPLDELAQAEVEKARRDPKFREICRKAEHLHQLEEQIATATGSDGVARFDEPSLSADERAVIDRLRGLLGTPAPVPQPEPEPEPQAADSADIEALRREYKEAVAEINTMLADMLPDPDQPPQMQRNYFSARKVAVFTTEKTVECAGWICNYCGCHHRQPSECAEPQLGGRWIYIENEVTVKKYV